MITLKNYLNRREYLSADDRGICLLNIYLTKIAVIVHFSLCQMIFIHEMNCIELLVIDGFCCKRLTDSMDIIRLHLIDG